MSAELVKTLAAGLVERHAARLGMDGFAASHLVDAIRSIEVAPAQALWCCHIIGPDDVHAAPDYQTALRWAVMLNRIMAKVEPSPLDDPNMPMCVAQVEPWAGDAASHAEALPAATEGMKPRVPA